MLPTLICRVFQATIKNRGRKGKENMEIIETTFTNDDNIIKEHINSILRYNEVYSDIIYQRIDNGGYYITLYYTVSGTMERSKLFFDNIIEVYYFLRGIEKTLGILHYNKKGLTE